MNAEGNGSPMDTFTVACGVCYDEIHETEAAELRDKHGHAWFVCPDCVGSLWAERRPALEPAGPSHQESLITEHEEAVMMLAALVGKMTAWRETLTGFENVPVQAMIDSMSRSITTARKVYSNDVD